MANSTLSNLISQESYRDHKRAQQKVSNVFLHYIYYYHKSYPKLHMLSMSPLYCYHKTNILLLWLKPLSKDERLLLYWVTQKNSINFQVQTSLPYIPQTVVCMYNTTNLPQSTCACYKTNMLLLYYMMLSVLVLSITFCVSHDCITMTITYVITLWLVWLSHVMLYHTFI